MKFDRCVIIFARKEGNFMFTTPEVIEITGKNETDATEELIGEQYKDSSPNEMAIKRDIEVITEEIQYHQQQVMCAFIEIGKLLIEAKLKFTKHGEWLEWLKNNVRMSLRMAQNYMKVAETFSNTQLVSHLGISKSLILLGVPKEELEDFLEETHDVNGIQKSIEDMSKRELKDVIRLHTRGIEFDENDVEIEESMEADDIENEDEDTEEDLKTDYFEELIGDTEKQLKNLRLDIYSLLDTFAKFKNEPKIYTQLLDKLRSVCKEGLKFIQKQSEKYCDKIS